jgi:hypothetical protein
MRKQLADNMVQMDWECPDCGEVATVNPDFYEENGTPLCECGEDMEYKGTFLVE